jgi:hypothetical protein
MSTVRRAKPLRPVLAPLTPEEPRPAIGEYSREELIALNLDLKKMLSAERRRNAKIEQILVKHLDETEVKNGNLRDALFSNLSAAMLERGRS